MASEDL